MTYYDIQKSILITTKADRIVSVEHRTCFGYDRKIEMNEDERAFYGRVGTAYHSGKRVTQMSSYLGFQAIVNYASPVKTGTTRHYSACDKFIDVEAFKKINLSPFFTDNIEIMPLLGYVVVNGKIKEPDWRLFESPCVISGKTAIPVMKNLLGDNIGQMAQLLTQGKAVYNSVYSTVFKNPFYGCTLSLLPLKDMGEPVVIMPWESFYTYFKGLNMTVAELTRSFPVELNCDHQVFGFDKVRVYTGTQPYLLSGFYGFLRYFTQAQVDFVYSYQGRHSDIVCGYDKVVVEKQDRGNQSEI